MNKADSLGMFIYPMFRLELIQTHGQMTFLLGYHRLSIMIIPVIMHPNDVMAIPYIRSYDALTMAHMIIALDLICSGMFLFPLAPVMALIFSWLHKTFHKWGYPHLNRPTSIRDSQKNSLTKTIQQA